MEYLFWAGVVVAVVVAGIFGYCQYDEWRSAKQQDDNEDKVLRELKDDDVIQAAIRRRTEMNRKREVNAIKQRAENQFRIDDTQWRDWN
jgi:hypothetical protein